MVLMSTETTNKWVRTEKFFRLKKKHFERVRGENARRTLPIPVNLKVASDYKSFLALL